jgi:hypothetical protein
MIAKCYCQHCQGEIEFVTEDLAGSESATANCPHCGAQTEFSLPQSLQTKNPPPVVAPVMIIQRTETAPQNVTVELKHGFSPLGIVALILGIIATVFCWIPFLGLLVIPLAAIGLLLALVGLVIAIVNKKHGLTLPISGGVLCLLSIFMAVFMTGVATGGIANIISSTGNVGTEWSKANTVRQGDIEVTIDYVVKTSPFSDGSESFIVGGRIGFHGYLNIPLSVSNLSSTKKVDSTTWRGAEMSFGGDHATLTDNNQNTYRRITGLSERFNLANEGAIYPGQTFGDLLIFELPVDNLQWLHLELPAQNFGGTGVIRFEIPKTRIKYIR